MEDAVKNLTLQIGNSLVVLSWVVLVRRVFVLFLHAVGSLFFPRITRATVVYARECLRIYYKMSLGTSLLVALFVLPYQDYSCTYTDARVLGLCAAAAIFSMTVDVRLVSGISALGLLATVRDKSSVAVYYMIVTHCTMLPVTYLRTSVLLLGMGVAFLHTSSCNATQSSAVLAAHCLFLLGHTCFFVLTRIFHTMRQPVC